jgi:serralysin
LNRQPIRFDAGENVHQTEGMRIHALHGAMPSSRFFLFLLLAATPPMAGGAPEIDFDAMERQRLLRQLAPDPGYLQSIIPPRPATVFGQCTVWNGVSYSLSSELSPAEALSFVESLPALGRHRYEWSGQLWESTATNGPVTVPGQRITLTWSLVPDGTMLYTIFLDEAPMVPSNLFATMDSGFGSRPFWVNLIRESFDDWGEILGIDYVEVTDDGAPQGAPGELGLRGDIRIGMQSIDTLGGILAFNFFPFPDDMEDVVPPGTGGDLTLDAEDILLWATDLGDGFMTLRNTVRHEHGHGLGFSHVDPLNQTKLMEALMTTAFDGPQEDDIRAGQRFYGDWLETNSAAAEATPLGMLPDGDTSPAIVVENLAIENEEAMDYFRFEVPDFSLLRYRIEPVGTEYIAGPQNGIVNPVNGRMGNDLAADLLLADGETVVATFDDYPIGDAEAGSYPMVPGAGEYFLRVRSSSNNHEVQRYALTLSTAPGSPDAQWETLAPQLDDSAGNGNGRLDPGESGVIVRVPVRNVGFSEGANLIGTLVSDTPTVSVLTGTLVYGTAAPGETLFGEEGYVIDVSSSHACGDPVELRFLTDSDAGPTDSSFSFRTGRPGLGEPVEYHWTQGSTIPVGGIGFARIAVADDMTIARVRLTNIDVTYPQLQDLIFFLQSPSGTVIVLSNNGFVGADLQGTTLSDEALVPISQGKAPYTGEFLPEGSLSELIGEPALGFWDFGVFNLLGQQSGRIDRWTLELSPVGGTICDDVPVVSNVESLSIY